MDGMRRAGLYFARLVSGNGVVHARVVWLP